jgi:hypothetical protein
VVELVDTPASGAGGLRAMQVRVLPGAPMMKNDSTLQRPGGEIGRRSGLKICRLDAVRVRVPLGAPASEGQARIQNMRGWRNW